MARKLKIMGKYLYLTPIVGLFSPGSSAASKDGVMTSIPGKGMNELPPMAFLHQHPHRGLRSVLPGSRLVRSSLTHAPLGASQSEPSENESSLAVDPFEVMYNDDIISSPSPPSSTWGVGDDWSVLSTAIANSATLGSPSSNNGNNFNAMDEAARILEEQDKMATEQSFGSEATWAASATSLSSSASNGPVPNLANKPKGGNIRIKHDAEFVENAVDMISNNYLDYADHDLQLYDTVSSLTALQNDRQEDEIAHMIRCNQSPRQLLLSQGRALPELTDEIKYSADFLLEQRQSNEQVSDDMPVLPLKPKMTSFFKNAVKEIFDEHSIEIKEEQMIESISWETGSQNGQAISKVDNLHVSKTKEKKVVSLQVMHREDISKWMTKCLNNPFEQRQDIMHVGPYDKSVTAILSRYSQNHGSGRLTFDEFQGLYVECAWLGYIRELREKKVKCQYSSGDYKIPSMNTGILIEGKKNTEKMLDHASLGIVWRDLEAHEIFSPVEEERLQLLKEIESLTSTSTGSDHVFDEQSLIDECELLDEYEDRLVHRAYSDYNDEDGSSMVHVPVKKEKTSHELVEMAFDGKTPKRIRDGQFVFIDEESCIGCTQCAQISPSSFKMIEETGRARAFEQRNTLDVENAVMACPVNCMHMMSFDELKELEVSRDDGDGRTDHRHFGQRRTHTPLFVAGIDSDANHKSSWYHYLKAKCSGEQCPQRGCYDCPKYSPGENPFFKIRHKQSEHIRAMDFMASGEADKWRIVADL